MSYKAQLQELWGKFTEEHGEAPTTIDECFEWASKNGLWHPKPQDVSRIFKREMGRALREQTRTDPSGRTYRAMQRVKETKGGVQLSLWGDTDKIPRRFMEKSVQQRRKGLVDDGYKLKMDVDHFNEYRSEDNPIQLVLNITEDVEEREIMEHYEKDEDREAS